MSRLARLPLQRWPPWSLVRGLVCGVGILIALAGAAQARPWSVRAVRISGDDQRTRIALETDRSATVRVLWDGRRGQILMEARVARGPAEPGGGGTGLVKVWSLDEERAGT